MLTVGDELRDIPRMAFTIEMERVRAVLTAHIAKPGESARGLALRAGLGPDAVRDILRNKSGQARVDTLAAIAKAMGGDLSIFSAGEPASVSAPPPLYPDVQSWPKDVPVHGTALGGDLALDAVTQAMQVEQTVLEFADTIEMVRRPPSFSGNRALYAVYVAGSSMEPRYEPGDLLYVDPRRPPAIGDDVVVQLRDGNGHDGDDRVICALIKRLVRRTGAGVELEQYNPPLRFKIAGEHIAAVHRVVKLGEVVGV